MNIRCHGFLPLVNNVQSEISHGNGKEGTRLHLELYNQCFPCGRGCRAR
jgi:hypothetical protein